MLYLSHENVAVIRLVYVYKYVWQYRGRSSELMQGDRSDNNPRLTLFNVVTDIPDTLYTTLWKPDQIPLIKIK